MSGEYTKASKNREFRGIAWGAVFAKRMSADSSPYTISLGDSSPHLAYRMARRGTVQCGRVVGVDGHLNTECSNHGSG